MQRHLTDTRLWLKSFSPSEQHELARYVPDIHKIYRDAVRYGGVEWSRDNVRNIVKGIGRIEETTAYALPVLWIHRHCGEAG